LNPKLLSLIHSLFYFNVTRARARTRTHTHTHTHIHTLFIDPQCM